MKPNEKGQLVRIFYKCYDCGDDELIKETRWASIEGKFEPYCLHCESINVKEFNRELYFDKSKALTHK